MVQIASAIRYNENSRLKNLPNELDDPLYYEIGPHRVQINPLHYLEGEWP